MGRSVQWLTCFVTSLVMMVVLIFGTAVTAGAQEADNERAIADDQKGWVAGRIEAVEAKSDSIVVDGRRFQFGDEVRMDGIALEPGEASQRLSTGDFVQIVHGQNYRNIIQSINTRQQ